MDLTTYTKILENLNKKVYVFFNLNEIFEQRHMFFLYLFLPVLFFVNLSKYYSILSAEVFKTECHAFFQNCNFLQNIYFANDFIWFRGIFFAFGMMLLFLAVFNIFHKKYGLAHLIFIVLGFLFIFPTFLLTSGYNPLINHQQHYFFYILLIFLFCINSRQVVLTLFFALTYFFSALPKILSIDWVLGTWKLPFLNQDLALLGSNILTFLQIILPFFLLYGKKWQRNFAASLFIAFHFYSVLISNVKFTFVLEIEPFLYVLFVVVFCSPKWQEVRKSFFGVLVLFVFSVMSLWRLFIPGNDYFTTEGSGLSLNMFFVNATCHMQIQDRNLQSIYLESKNFKYPCDVSKALQFIKKECVDERSRTWKMSLVNKFSTFKIVDVENYCDLEYTFFGHNSWIHDDFEMFPEKDLKLSFLQNKILPYVELFQTFYYFTFCLIGFLILYFFLKNPKN